MSSITILREPAQYYGLDRLDTPRIATTVQADAMAEMNIIPMRRSCFEKMIKKQVAQMNNL